MTDAGVRFSGSPREHATGGDDVRVDAVTGAVVRVVPARQDRPNQPAGGCPFCVGGIESPRPYRVRSFPNRWPSMDGDRCEVVLYGPEHGQTLASLGSERAREVIDLWADRTGVQGSREDVSYVLPFENHGAEVGATIDHPHGQLWAFPQVPPTPLNVLTRLEDGADLLEAEHGLANLVVECDGWRAWTPHASAYPHQVRIAPLERVPDLPSLDDGLRDAFAVVLVDVLGRFERRFDPPMPYMFWVVQRPSDGMAWGAAWLHAELVSPWRDQNVQRYMAAGELGGGVLVNPVDPARAAAELRELGAD
jgi:UDPglucose--hexose-1-phosphate uridylyltransferase